MKSIHFGWQAVLNVILGLGLVACGNQAYQAKPPVTSHDTAIIGGRTVSVQDAEIASTVGIWDRKLSGLCTGTLLSRRLVLTAAHCLESSPSEVVVFFNANLEKVTRDNARRVRDYGKFEGYNPKASSNMGDIALILLEGSDPLPPPYVPVEILSDFSVLRESTSFVAVGYGLSKAWIKETGSGILRKVELNIMDPRFTETEVAVSQTIHRGVCSGDSGGPGYLRINGKLYLWGVVSRGDSIPIPFVPKCALLSIYTRVDVYLPWIERMSQELLQAP
jgi:secreted trypsin-like serine protease